MVTYHPTLKAFIVLLVVVYIVFLLDGFAFSEEPSASHWALLFLGIPSVLFGAGTVLFSYIVVDEHGIEKRWGLSYWAFSLKFLPWPDITHVKKYNMQVTWTEGIRLSGRQTGVEYQSKSGDHLRIPYPLVGAEDAIAYSLSNIPRKNIDSQLLQEFEA